MAAPTLDAAAPFVPSTNIAHVQESATIAVSQRAKALRAAGRAVIDLGAGEPDFDTPAYIRRAARDALELPAATRYTAVDGILSLREVIAERANESYRGPTPVDPRDVVVTTGSKQALFNACFALFGAGDEVLIPTPAWTSYYEMVSLARATAVAVPGDPARDLKVGVAELEAAATERTRGLFLNSPCNPTGAVYSREELTELLALADRHGWWVISDEIYRRIAYEERAPSVLEAAAGRERLVVVNGMAKAYAMTGWRIGWAVAPREAARTMTALQSHTTSNAATISQYAALAALSDRDEGEAAIASMVAAFRRRRDLALAEVAREPRLRLIHPAGAFYLFFDVSPTAAGSVEAGTAFARHLLEHHDVAVVPGAAFRAPAWVRLSYAAPDGEVVEGVRRLVTAYGESAG